jgi:1-aminocyclopropane-1-carboxylate deaminase/D-cysteine desulfhydrase-like pyridoxal-dependent ACC family enzyme
LIKNSPITPFVFRGNFYHIKRDDLLHKDFNGNKARKFYYFLKNDFPSIKRVVSFGSNQSNAMYSLSVLAKIKGWEFIYYTNHIPNLLKQNPHGNFLNALKNGMKIIEIKKSNEEIREFVKKLEDNETLIIEEGGRIKEAEYGIKILAEEINEFALKNNLKVFLPSGTGTTAYFLAKHLDVEVITLPVVGDEEYLKKQFKWLGGEKIPTILKPLKKYHFAKPYKHFWELFLELKKSGIEFDLIYDMIAWEAISFYGLKNLLFIHQGNMSNSSMIPRYKHKFKI